MDWLLYDRDLRHERVNIEAYLNPCKTSMLEHFCKIPAIRRSLFSQETLT